MLAAIIRSILLNGDLLAITDIMSFLENLSKEDRELVASLPYRVGLLVSQTDGRGGSVSDVQEIQALSNIIHAYSGEKFSCETVQYIINETIQREDIWPKWAAEPGDVEGDCEKGVELLRPHVDEKELSGFKTHLMEIGETVALAFREMNDLSLFEEFRLWVYYHYLRNRAKMRGCTYKTYEQFRNISYEERTVLSRLCTILQVDYAF